MDIQLKRGFIEICVLSLLSKGDSYGYALIRDVSECVEISESTLYPILKRLESAKLLTVYSEEYNEIALWLYDTDPSYQTTNFGIKGNNVSIALENGILDKVKIGDTITVTSAPRFFYNGYAMPIIGLSIGDIEILNIETGHQNLMDMY